MADHRQVKVEKLQRQDAKIVSYVGRRYFILGLFGVVAIGLSARAFDQQILEKDFLQSEGADRYLTKVKVEAHRGLITDRRGDVLALSTPVDSVAANPRLFKTDEAGLQRLANALKMPVEVLGKKIASHRGRGFVYLRRRLPPPDAKYVIEVAKSLGIRGMQLDREYRRYYPAGEVFSHVVGITNIDDKGQEGLELAFENDLRGKPGVKLVMRDGRRQVVDDIENILSPRDGRNLALSLDRRLQFVAYRELKAAVKKHKAESASLVMLDTKTGEVLAMVSQPSYNPNGRRDHRDGRMRNRTLTDTYEPGSTMKPFAIAAALDSGIVEFDSVIDTTPGFYHIGEAKIKDHRNYGAIDVATVLKKSSNVGVSKIALELDQENYWDFMTSLGFGEYSGGSFPGEVAGYINGYQNWAKIDQATLSFGYGLSVTSLQLARAYSALAADGVLRPVSLLKLDKAPVGERVISKQTAQRVREMLQAVVSPEGTAPLAAVPGYYVAGKTGTVKKLSPTGGYSEDDYLALFAGVAPATNPRLAIAVVVDNPTAGEFYGGQVAAPVFSKVMAESLRLLNIRPDRLPKQPVRLAQAEGF